MSEIGERMVSELKRIREVLELTQPLGFGKRREAQWLNVWLQHVDNVEYVWYLKEKTGGRDYREQRDLTGYLMNLWRYDATDKNTGKKRPKLVAHLHADKDYYLRTGFYTNFSQTLMAGLLELPDVPLSQEPLTLVAESFAGTKAEPTVFCRVEYKGLRMQSAEKLEHKILFEKLQARFGFKNPLERVDDETDDEAHDG
jgi:hypothetical protein